MLNYVAGGLNIKTRNVFISGVAIIFITLLLLLPTTVNAANVVKNLYASGSHTGTANPPTFILTRTLPSTPTTVNVPPEGSDVDVNVYLDLSVNNPAMTPADYTEMDYQVDFYALNSFVNIIWSNSGTLTVYGSSGSNGTQLTLTYQNVYPTDFFIVSFDLDLYAYQYSSTPPPGGYSQVAANTMNASLVRVNAY